MPGACRLEDERQLRLACPLWARGRTGLLQDAAVGESSLIKISMATEFSHPTGGDIPASLWQPLPSRLPCAVGPPSWLTTVGLSSLRELSLFHFFLVFEQLLHLAPAQRGKLLGRPLGNRTPFSRVAWVLMEPDYF